MRRIIQFDLSAIAAVAIARLRVRAQFLFNTANVLRVGLTTVSASERPEAAWLSETHHSHCNGKALFRSPRVAASCAALEGWGRRFISLSTSVQSARAPRTIISVTSTDMTGSPLFSLPHRNADAYKAHRRSNTRERFCWSCCRPSGPKTLPALPSRRSPLGRGPRRSRSITISYNNVHSTPCWSRRVSGGHPG